VIPNYRSAEFLVFCTLALSFWRRQAERPEQVPTMTYTTYAKTVFDGASSQVNHKEKRPC